MFSTYFILKNVTKLRQREGKKITLAAARLFAAANLSKLFLKRKKRRNEATKSLLWSISLHLRSSLHFSLSIQCKCIPFISLHWLRSRFSVYITCPVLPSIFVWILSIARSCLEEFVSLLSFISFLLGFAFLALSNWEVWSWHYFRANLFWIFAMNVFYPGLLSVF